jgi:hypothetical protein
MVSQSINVLKKGIPFVLGVLLGLSVYYYFSNKKQVTTTEFVPVKNMGGSYVPSNPIPESDDDSNARFLPR